MLKKTKIDINQNDFYLITNKKVFFFFQYLWFILLISENILCIYEIRNCEG